VNVNVKIELPQWLLLAAMWAVALASWSTAPERIPVHWNMHGEVDRYGGRFEGLLLVPLVALGIYLLLLFLPRLDPGRANYAQFAGAYAIIRIAVLAMMTAVHAVIILAMRGAAIDVGTVVIIAAGALFVVLGNVRPNWFVGIRTPWTLSSKTAWTKTHRVGGWIFIGLGLLVMAVGAVRTDWAIIALIASALGSTLFLFVYSYVAWRSATDKTPPAGTLPADERREI
jgi:uncharacterized membrane protein